jgi:hypothetical protein
LLSYPRFTIDERVAEQSRELLKTSLAPAIHRSVSDRLDDLNQVLNSRH